MDKNRLLSK